MENKIEIHVEVKGLEEVQNQINNLIHSLEILEDLVNKNNTQLPEIKDDFTEQSNIKDFLEVEDLQRILNRKQAYCYKLIRTLNNELKEQGYQVSTGRVSTRYFCKRMNLNPDTFVMA